MTFAPWFLGGFLVLFLLNYIIAAGILWGSARVFRVPEVRFRRALLAILLIVLLNLPLLALESRFFTTAMPWALPVLLAMTVASWIVYLVGSRIALPKEKRLRAASLAFVLQSVYGGICIFVLQTWVAEAFVIPTGSMAETLWGYHKMVRCPECGQEFAVNASAEMDTVGGRPVQRLTACTCPNCRNDIDLESARQDPPLAGGDRILCAKLGYGSLERLQVAAYRYPVEPVRNGVTMNYVGRIVGLPGETIAIAQGELYVHASPRQVPTPEQFWSTPYSGFSWRGETEEERQAHDEAEKLFAAGKFQIIRKSPDEVLARRQLVYDNNQRGKDGPAPRPRWRLADQVEPAPATGDFVLPQSADLSWLRYTHFNQPFAERPELITDFSGYNSGNTSMMPRNGAYWVGDLLLECQAATDQAQGELRLDLCKGNERFQAVFDLASGQCSLTRLRAAGQPAETLANLATTLRRPGTNQLGFANVDARLIVWVNGQSVFGNGVDYDPGSPQGPTVNDLTPASIGASGTAVTLSNLRLWRDVYYTTFTVGMSRGGDVALAGHALANPERWDDPQLRKPTPML
ncbi:MAG: hypothetical protein JNM56_08970, partial [Planctomycetia bacterium]|nr:hypothetical protein [Planctomycetia bacterium]